MSRHISKWSIALLVAVVMTFSMSAPVLAADLRGGDVITVASDEVVDDDLYIAGSDVVIDGTINGDLWAIGSTITVNGEVNGSIVAAGETVNINGTIAHAARLAGDKINVSGKVNGDLITFSNNVNVASKGSIGGDFLFGSGNVRIDGPVAGYIKGGGTEVAINSSVGEDVELQADKLILSPAANIGGNLTYTSANEADIQSGAIIAGQTTHNLPEAEKPGLFSGFMGKFLGFVMAFITGVIIIMLAPARSRAIADIIKSRPWASLGWGALMLFATPVAVILACCTIIGIPVALIVLALYAIAVYISQIFAGLFLGRWIIGRYRNVDAKDGLIGSLAAGLAIIALLKWIPFIGFWVGLFVALFGLGAMLISLTKLGPQA